jgi:hypothetical protein
MVPQRRGRGKHILIPIAGLIMFMVSACIPGKQVPAAAVPEHKACDHLESVSGFIGIGDFDGAMKQTQSILAGSTRTAGGDEALMVLGLISAHNANPKRDYKKALVYFQRMEKEYPQSPLVVEARIWVGVLHAFEKAKQVDIEIEEKKKGLGK